MLYISKQQNAKVVWDNGQRWAVMAVNYQAMLLIHARLYFLCEHILFPQNDHMNIFFH